VFVTRQFHYVHTVNYRLVATVVMTQTLSFRGACLILNSVFVCIVASCEVFFISNGRYIDCLSFTYATSKCVCIYSIYIYMNPNNKYSQD
jgi:hypothetical protein